mgnify:CR=1 FL=1
MDADFSPITSRLRAKDSDGKEYIVGALTVREKISQVGEITVLLAAKNYSAALFQPMRLHFAAPGSSQENLLPGR